ncbi:putative aspartate oxidase [Neobacillus bataviensis LMG 21833]|uniref:L-aspartate oxidase n=1 Tax=Neobacillus bataviensis LMG 21833 TaxID=1117379 RepID=K6D1Z4_9BACI|nr:FAD-binding protein [Neobacillus bataviensis]EKN66487.1 putative aspartate oxidase [Neobacillus bataviensis LMG 21833]
MIKISRKVRIDVLVAGSGLSGIKVSKELADQHHQVLLVTKLKIASGSSFYPLKASLGTQVTKDEDDQEIFLRDIENLSRGMHRQDLAEVYVKEIPDRVQEYAEIGVNAKKLAGERKACFAEHPRDIYLLSDWDQIRENVRGIFELYENLKIMENTVVIHLIKKEQQIVGALLLDEENELVLVECKAVILATGGFGSIYKHNLNPNDVDGSGHVLALEAGASLVNMEFIQFIPGITTPRYKTLFGEHTLMYCHDIVDENGESLLDPYLPEGVSRKECLKIRSTHGPFTHSLASKYVDIAMMKQIIASNSEEGFKLLYDSKLYENEEEFYTVYLNWLKEKNIHLIENEIRIAPFAHASNGGVFIDTFGRTRIAGLYAIGELSCNIEGANRLGGNSTGACMVFGKRAAVDCGKYVQTVEFYNFHEHEGIDHVKKLFGNDAESNNSGTQNEHNDLVNQVHKMIGRIKEIMWYHGNVVRSEKQLSLALIEIKKMESKVNWRLFFEQKATRKLAVKARNFIKLSKILLRAMLERKESRGAHYREDYPYEDSKFAKRLFVSEDQDSKIQYEFLHK